MYMKFFNWKNGNRIQVNYIFFILRMMTTIDSLLSCDKEIYTALQYFIYMVSQSKWCRTLVITIMYFYSNNAFLCRDKLMCVG